MEKFANNVRLAVEYKKGHMVYIKGGLNNTEMYNLQWYIEDYKCRKRVDFRCGVITVIFTGKNNMEMLQDEKFKKMFLHPGFNVLENL